MSRKGVKPQSYRHYRGRSIGDILDETGGVGFGFDLLRLLLATAIVLSHVSGITGHHGVTNGIIGSIFGVDAHTQAKIANAAAPGIMDVDNAPIRGVARPLTLGYLAAFFSLSGFLVAASAFRTRKLLQFLGLRALRLIPALLVETVLSAFMLGALFTTLPLGRYFTDPLFFRYFGNIVGEVSFYLPGVFGTAHEKAVNANLWTLPYEMRCYALLSVLMVVGVLFKNRWLTGAFVAATLLAIYFSIFHGWMITAGKLPGLVLVYYFIVGLLFYVWRYKIPFHEGLFAGAAVVAYPLMMFPKAVFIYPIAVVYMTVFFGMFPVPQFKLLRTGDYSYGIYLYGFPVTQALVTSFPSLKSSMFAASAAALIGTFAFAVFSWHAVEKHCLKLKWLLNRKSAHITESLHPDDGMAQAAPMFDGGAALARSAEQTGGT
jgi:peptidoglycan/LPS O-acetylase OafA/YrhL